MRGKKSTHASGKKNLGVRNNEKTKIGKKGRKSLVGGKKLGEILPVKKTSLKLRDIYKWSIALSGIPKSWKGNIEEITEKYKEFNVQAHALERKNFEREICQILYLFFNDEEDMIKAVTSGQREFLEKTLTVRTVPARTVYISGIPLNVDVNLASSELKNALGSAVYDITFPSSNGKLLGYAIAYIMNEKSQEELLNCSFNLWDSVQQCCSEDVFFKKYTLRILFGLGNDTVDILQEWLNKKHENNVQVSVDIARKLLFFADESSVEKCLEKCAINMNGKKIILSRSPKTTFFVKNIDRRVKKSNIQDLLHEINAFNVHFKKLKSKANFDAPEEDAEKCRSLHHHTYFGKQLEVFQIGSEELKQHLEKSRKKIEERGLKKENLHKSRPNLVSEQQTNVAANKKGRRKLKLFEKKMAKDKSNVRKAVKQGRVKKVRIRRRGKKMVKG